MPLWTVERCTDCGVHGQRSANQSPAIAANWPTVGRATHSILFLKDQQTTLPILSIIDILPIQRMYASVLLDGRCSYGLAVLEADMLAIDALKDEDGVAEQLRFRHPW